MISGAFYRGTTPTHSFTLPFEAELVSDLRITYSQNKKTIFTKGLSDVELDKNEISFILTQQETYMFEVGKEVLVQIKIKTKEGLVLNSDIMTMRVDESLDNEVI